MSETKIDAQPRSDFGKGSARRTRREGRIPAVLYGHGMEPAHLGLAGHDLTMALRQGGLNTLLTIEVDGKEELALPKDVQVDPLRREILHVDLLLVKRGEKVIVDIPIVLIGDVVPGGQVNHDLTTASVEAEATRIPEQIEVDIESLQVGDQVLAGDLALPEGTTLLTDAEAMVLAISEVLEADVESDAVAEEPIVVGGAEADEEGAAEETGEPASDESASDE